MEIKRMLVASLMFPAVLSVSAVNVDSNKIRTFVGSGQEVLPVVIRWEDDSKINNVVWGVRYDGSVPTDQEALTAIKGGDSRFTAGKGFRALSLDVDADGVSTQADQSCSSSWTSEVSDGVMTISFAGVSATPDYLFYIPDANQTGVYLPEEIVRPLSDGDYYIPVFFNGVASGDILETWYNKNAQGKNSTDVIAALDEKEGFGPALTTYKGIAGDVYVTVEILNLDTDDETVSNTCHLMVTPPLKPVNSIILSGEPRVYPNGNFSLSAVLSPEDATYTALNWSSSDPAVIAVDRVGKLTVKVYGDATVTCSSKYIPLGAEAVSAQISITSGANVPISSVDFGEGTEDGVITVNVSQMARLIPHVYPENSDIRDVTITLTENPSVNGVGVVAQPYSVNYFNTAGSKIHTEDMMAFREGTARLKVTAADGYSREFTVNVVNPENPVSDFTDGTLILNEDWFGHVNSGLNYITPDYEMVYNPYMVVNGGLAFGCTAQHATIYADRLIVVSKQHNDPQDPRTGGGRVVVADARTLQRIGSIDELKWTGDSKTADGRAAVGAGDNKAFVSSNNGIYIIDLNTVQVIGKVQGDALNGSTDLYSNQTGDMVYAGEYVFAVHQNNGLIAINPTTGMQVKTFGTPLNESGKKSVQGVTLTSGGKVWYVEQTSDCQQFVCIDPSTLEIQRTVALPENIKSITCGWGAWRPCQFTGDLSSGSLWFVPASADISGGAVGEDAKYYRWDTSQDISTAAPVFTLAGLKGSQENQQMVYGQARYDDRTGELIVMATETGASGHYAYNWYYFVDPETGEINNEVVPATHFWFQSMPVFPDKYDVELKDEYASGLMLQGTTSDPVTLDLRDIITDRDNHDANIKISTFAQTSTRASEIASFETDGTILKVTPRNLGNTNYLFDAESNGRKVRINLPVSVGTQTGVMDTEFADISVRIEGNRIYINGHEGETFRVYTSNGEKVMDFTVDSFNYIAEFGFQPGVYLLSGRNISLKFLIN